MKTKVTLEQRQYNHWIYLVYMKRDNDHEWIALQYFKHNQRKKAIDYAKDLSTVNDIEVEVDIWMSE